MSDEERKRVGRPRVADELKHRTFRISMSPRHIKLTQDEAERMGMYQASLFRALLNYYEQIPIDERHGWIEEQLGGKDELYSRFEIVD